MTKLVVLAALLIAPPVLANPRALPFTYTTDTLPAGQAELEQTVDLVPLRATNATSGERAWYLASAFQTELEIGLCDRLELALYFTMAPTIANLTNTAELPDTNGMKQRLRYIFAPQGEWPVDVGVYGELAENEHEVELEAKLLLQRRFDKLRVAANLWAEYELEFDSGELERNVVLHPTLGATYELTPKLHVGIDSWMRGTYPQGDAPAVRTFELGPEYYVGPSVMMSFGKVWWTVAAYARVSDVKHELAPGEPYGPVWVRTMVGYNL